jgi:hypothetical protein
VGFDARGIWMLHAVWFEGGHRTVLTALRAGTMPFAHPSYPPLVGGTVAVAWQITGDHAYRLGVVMVACLNAASVLALGWALFELGRRTARVVAGRRGAVLASVAAVSSVLLVLAAFEAAGPFTTNGYADLLWSSAAVGAVAYGLVLSGRGVDLGATGVLLAVAVLTKDEGIAVGVGIVVLLATRRAVSDRRPWRSLVAGVCALACVGAWPALVRLLGAHGDVANIGRNTDDDLNRARLTFDAMVPHLHVLLLAAPVAVAGALVAGRLRGEVALGNDIWSWAAIAVGTCVIAAVYVFGPGSVELWLLTSVHRTTMFTSIGVWWEIGTWTVLAAAAAARRAPERLRRELSAVDRGRLEIDPCASV